jgi:hypothetical protein
VAEPGLAESLGGRSRLDELGRRLPSLAVHELVDAGPVTAAVRAAGCGTLREAFALVWLVPYGRNRDRGDFLAVLEERRGTCSSKHALLSLLAAEQRLDITLHLGIYLMSERNTPGIEEVLARHGLPSIPEAHCFMRCDGSVVDVTRLPRQGTEPIAGFLYEERIGAGQVVEHKPRLHREFLERWAAEGRAGGLTAHELWAIREECIAALGEV